MAQGSIRVLRTVPGSTSLGPIVRDFCRRPDGVVTAFSDAALPLARRFVEEDDAVEVQPFGDFVRSILEMCGEPALRIAGNPEQIAAVAHACLELEEESPFLRTARFPGLHKAIVSTLKELHQWGIDAFAMETLAARTSPRLAAKLRSLAQVDRGAEEVLASLGRQTHTAHLRASLECMPERDGGFERLLVIGGNEECPLRIQWLRWIASQGTEVTVVFDRHAADAPLFAGARRGAALLGVDPISIGDGNVLTRNLFAPELTGGGDVAVEIVSAADPLAEAEWALRGCLEEERPDLAAIYVRDLEGYAPLIEAAAKRLGVPVRMARRAPLLTNSFARLTLNALEFLASRDVRTLAPIVKSSYLGLNGVQQNRITSRLRTAYATRERQWETLFEWTQGEEGAEFPWIRELLDWRQKALGARYALREWKPLLDELINHKEIPWSIRRESGDRVMIDRDRRARNQMERLLTNHVSVDAVTRESSASLAEVVNLCRRLWEDADVSVPSAEFGVLVTDSIDNLTDAERLHVMGMLEGVFPRRRSEEPILTDDERREISDLRPGEPALLDSHDRAGTERDTFYRVCAAARKKLVCSYPQADDQRDNIPAFYLSEIERAAKKVTRIDLKRLELAPITPACQTDADRRLREALEGPREYPAELELFTDASRAALRPEDGHRFTPTELRDALQCPFQYSIRHRIRVPVRRRQNRWQSLRKLPQVSGLIGQTTMAAAESALIQALDAELDTLYADVSEWEMQLLRAGGQRLIRDWLRREFRARETWAKDPASVRRNVNFGDEGLRDKMPGGVEIDGQVAAISKFQGYSVAHLYGSGARDPKNLTEVEKLFYGLYFLALHEAGREGALEIESMSGKRELVVLSRWGGPVNGHVQDGLSVVDLSTADDPSVSRRVFFEDVKRALKRAVERVRDARIDAMKGDHCDWCDYGELCRRSRAFGEEDSPFGRDVVFDDV
ncbi:MAG: PD-(D/E)XK nuclease family protein [Fimbriimonas sp.]